MRSILTDPRLRLFYLGNTVSAFGDYALYLALGVWVKTLTSSTGLAGVGFLALILGSLTSPLTGVVVDRCRRKPLMIWTYLATAALLASLLTVHDRHQLWLLFSVSFGYGVSGTVTATAQQALVQRVVPEDLLADANGLQQTVTQGMRLITPLAGVGLFAWLGPHAVVLMNVATFLVAVACLLAIDIDEERPSGHERHWASDVTTGFGYLARTPVLRQIVLASTVIILAIGFYETLALQVVTVGLHHAPTWIGVFVAVQGIGGLAGGLTAGWVARRIGEGLLTAAGMALMTMMSLLVAVPAQPVVLAGSVLGGAALPWLIVGATTALQKNTPNRMAGRVMGAAELALSVPQSVGIALGAALVDVVFYRYLSLAAAAATALGAVYLATRPEQRRPALVWDEQEMRGGDAPDWRTGVATDGTDLPAPGQRRRLRP